MSMGDDVDLGLKAILAGPRDVHNDHITHTYTSKRDKGRESEREGNTIEGISNFDVY